MRIALFEPDIPQNTGAVLRLGACLQTHVDIIEPAGFLLDDRRLKRVVMDYAARVEFTRHTSWRAFEADRARAGDRLVLLSTSGATLYTEFAFAAGDRLLLGRESAGVPDAVRAASDASVVVPMAPGARSLNVAMAGAIVLAEALRQTGRLPGGER